MAAEFWSGGLYRSALAATVAVSALAIAPAAHAEKYAAIVVDAATGEVLHARNEDDPRYPASLTKVMTLYLLFEAIDSGEVTLTDRMTVSRAAASQPPSNLRLRAGDRMRVEDAIYALVTKSANDVAVVVAEYLAGSERAFAERMTARARELGLESTTFRNASGLPDAAQVSTARDLAMLADAVMNHFPHYYHYFQNQQFSWGGTTYRNHNELIRTVDGVDGIKTGYTRASGFNLMTSAVRDDRRVIAIMLGGATARSRNTHVTELVETAFLALGQTPGTIDPGNRPVVFAAVRTPSNPNGAAEPMLNGRRLSDILAEQTAKAAAEAGPEFARELPEYMPEYMEGDGTDQAAPTEIAAFGPVDYDVASEFLAAPSDYIAAPVAAQPEAPEPSGFLFDGSAVADYNAAQIARATAGARVADYTRRQTRRR
ncbi:D-alanyl-D-alanine carboxypeptidase family protein [Hyphomonas sp.]|uniref:D-alanyl-D-alanine carboxypeptidase family protein n=1 Tax=Hyphomonas sp. TaxID=87 RepID=UPI00391CC615